MDFDGIEAVNVRALGSADVVTVNDMSATDVKSVDVDLNGFDGGPDGAADAVVVTGTDGDDNAQFVNSNGLEAITGLGTLTRVTGNDDPLDKLEAATLDGADTVTMNVGVAGSVPFDVDGGDGADTVRYDGTADADTIGIARNGTEVATFAPGTALLNTTAVESEIVSGLAGNDLIAAQNGIATLTTLTLDGGDDNDDLRGGDGADTLIGGKGNDHVDGNIGADTAQLGAGDDTFQWDPGDGSDVVEGQSGTDTLAFNGSNAGEQIEVSANGSRGRLTRNIAGITMDFDGIEGVAIRALGSSDAITVVDLDGTAVKTVDVDLSGFDGNGDGAADAVTVNGTDRRDVVDVTRTGSQVLVSGLAAQTRIVGSEPAVDSLRVQTGAGNDDVTVAPDVGDVIVPVVDLGGDE
jgi:hypothetical protein